MTSPRNNKRKRAGLVAALVVLLGLQLVGADSNTVRLVSCEYPPYYGKDLKNHGFITEIVVQAFKRSAYEVQVEFLPWARALKLAKAGKCDGIFTIWYRKDREEWILFSDPLPPNFVGFYKRKGRDISFRTLEDLKPYSIGIVRGYYNPPEFKKASYLRKEEATTDEQNLRKLAMRRVDLALTDRLLAKYTIQTKLPDHADVLEWLDPPLETVTQHVGFPKRAAGHRKTCEAFNRGLKLAREDGTIRKIMDKHGFADVAFPEP